jgi:hypothetical protein
MTVQEYLMVINEKFPYLFKDYGFKVIYTNEFRPDHNVIGIESELFRILFEQERGGFTIFVGMSDASFDDKKAGWVNLHSLMIYLLKREIDWSPLDKAPYSEQMDIMFSITAKEFAALYQQIAEMFRSHHVTAQWKPAYDQYLRERIQQRLARK